MSNYSTNEFKNGLKLMVDNAPCNIVENILVKPGKGQAFNRVKFRNLLTGRMLERTLKSGESLPAADVVDVDLQYLYNDGENWHFMDPKTFDQFAISADQIGDTKLWLKEQDMCAVILYNGSPISVVPPKFVEMKIVESDPGLKGDTVSGGSKPATLESGAVVRVPLFIDEGEVIKVNTETGEYDSRVKD